MLTLLTLCLSPLPGLADPSWHAREKAQQQLVSRSWLAAPTLWVGERSEDCEVRSRCRRVWCLLASARVAEADREFPLPTDYPFLDALWYDVQRKTYVDNPWTELRLYIQAACANTDAPFAGIHYGPYRQASRDWMRAGVAAGVPLWVYRVAFAEMRQRDLIYLGKGG